MRARSQVLRDVQVCRPLTNHSNQSIQEIETGDLRQNAWPGNRAGLLFVGAPLVGARAPHPRGGHRAATRAAPTLVRRPAWGIDIDCYLQGSSAYAADSSH